MKRGDNMQRSAFWVEFIIMVGILLLVTEMTLLGVSKAHQISMQNQREIDASVHLQNIMEYCKMNPSQLEEQLEQLENVIKYHNDWIILYDTDWKSVDVVQDSAYYIKIHYTTTPYAYQSFQDIEVGAYTIEDETLILELKGGVCA